MFKKAFKKDEIICSIVGYTIAKKSWSTIQISENEHCELNSELVLMNHSCDPTVEINVKSMQVVALRNVNAGIKFFNFGEQATFFYPSTEYELSQPFECWCGSAKCIKTVRGSKYL